MRVYITSLYIEYAVEPELTCDLTHAFNTLEAAKGWFVDNREDLLTKMDGSFVEPNLNWEQEWPNDPSLLVAKPYGDESVRFIIHVVDV